MKKFITISGLALFLAACGGGAGNANKEESASSDNKEQSEKAENGNPSYDPKRGEGKFSTVDIGEHLDAAKAEAGKKVHWW